MTFKNGYIILGTFFVTLLGAMSSSYAASKAEACSAIFTSPSEEIQVKSLTLLNDIVVKTEKFGDFVRDLNKPVVEQAELQEWIDLIARISEKYFADNNIKVKRQVVNRENLNFENKVQIPQLTYIRYKIVGVKNSTDKTNTDKNGLFINGFFQSKKLKDITLIYDPFLHYVRSEAGFFVLTENTFYLGYLSFPFHAMGLGNILGHETSHAHEEYKLLNDEPTLASFELSNFLGNPENKDYQKFLRADELESYLRDTRFFKNIGPRRDYLQKNENVLKIIRANRAVTMKARIKKLEELIVKVKIVLHQFREMILTNPRPSFVKRDKGILRSAYMFLKNEYYPIVFFYIKDKGYENNGLQSIVLERVSWAEKRIREIEAELEQLKKL